MPTHSIKDKDENLLKESHDINKRWIEYFEDLLNFSGGEGETRKNKGHLRQVDVEDIKENGWLISEEELIKISCGYDEKWKSTWG